MKMRWTFWIDVGGTFTDCFGRAPDGEWHRTKVLSNDDAPIQAIRKLMGISAGEAIGPISVALGTTRGTNALLERKGAQVALVTTKGFGDVLEIGTQARPHLFKLKIDKPPSLHRHVVEVDERLDSAGRVIKPLDEHEVRQRLQELKQRGVSSIAICLVHAYVNDQHEKRHRLI